MFTLYDADVSANEFSQHSMTYEEVGVMGSVTSRSTQDKAARTYVVMDTSMEVVEFFHNGKRFVDWDACLRNAANVDQQGD